MFISLNSQITAQDHSRTAINYLGEQGLVILASVWILTIVTTVQHFLLSFQFVCSYHLHTKTLFTDLLTILQEALLTTTICTMLEKGLTPSSNGTFIPSCWKRMKCLEQHQCRQGTSGCPGQFCSPLSVYHLLYLTTHSE